jgi:hypothetical protein
VELDACGCIACRANQGRIFGADVVQGYESRPVFRGTYWGGRPGITDMDGGFRHLGRCWSGKGEYRRQSE